ncbi:MAG: TIGR04283 family arsenosugar biosynthesis glycosyltransferase [Verrucomicrobia bacterium]|nr:TIGR04283 family arsenosugar biosynthesis glycosyltransferase [Verrucomicrobiota bacterium]
MNRNSSPSRIEPVEAVSVTLIVPSLNEERNLHPCLAAAHAAGHEFELIVVDGGSTDRTSDIARSFGATVVKSPIAQRAAQMNHGAERAHGNIFVFLHADTILPPDWLTALRGALHRQPETVGGVFRRRFNSESVFLRLTCRLADWRARQFGWFLGDQTIFVRRAAFRAAGGFSPMKAFEDLEFSLRLSKLGHTTVLPTTAVSSGRRFLAKGPVRQTLADLRMTMRFLRDRRAFGAAPTSRV